MKWYTFYIKSTLLGFENHKAGKGITLACPMVGYDCSNVWDYLASTISRMLASFF
jgi:hypothetical protein